MADIVSKIRGLRLSASELKLLRPDWPDAIVEDYLTISDNIAILADGVDDNLSPEDVLGTEKQIIVTINADRTITLSTPQDIDTDADVVFDTATLDKLILSLTAALTPSEGEMAWNVDDGTVDVGLPGGVVGQMFQELFFDGKNKTGADIPDGTPIMFAAPIGASGKVEIMPAIADGSYPSQYIMGMASEAIADGEFGKVTWFGKVRGIDTSGTPYGEVWADGDLIYVGLTAGSLTNVEPNAPYQRILIATVIKAHANMGTLLLRPSWNETLKDLDDVNGTPLTINGQLMIWDNINGYFDFTDNINNYSPTEDGTAQGQIAFWDAALGKWVHTETSELFWDDTNKRLLVNTSSGSYPLSVLGDIGIKDANGDWFTTTGGGVAAYTNSFSRGKWQLISSGSVRAQLSLTSSTGWLQLNTSTGTAVSLRANAASYFLNALGLGLTTPTAVLHLKAGTAAAGTAPLKFTAGTALTTPETGVIEFHDDRFWITNVGRRRAIDRTNDIIKATTEVTNTVTETTIYTGHIELNGLKAGNILKFNASGSLTNATASDDITIKIYLGTDEVLSFSPAIGNVADAHWHIKGNMTVRTTGVAGTMAYHLDALVDDHETLITGLGSVDTTVAQDFTVTVEWDNAKAGNSIEIYQGFTEWKG